MQQSRTITPVRNDSLLSHCCVEDALYLAVAGYAVNGGVWTAVLPCAIIDDVVGRIIATAKHEGGNHVRTLQTYIAVPAVDVISQLLHGRIGVCPLVRIARLGHEPACYGEYALHSWDVFKRRFANCYHCGMSG